MNRRQLPLLKVILALLGLSIGCTGILLNQPLSSTTVTPEVQKIFTANCTAAGCHNGLSRTGGINLEPGASDAIVGRPSSFRANPVVNPGKPEQSELFLRITSLDPVRRMPRGRGPLSAANIETIRLWIVQGALNN